MIVDQRSLHFPVYKMFLADPAFGTIKMPVQGKLNLSVVDYLAVGQINTIVSFADCDIHSESQGANVTSAKHIVYYTVA